MSAARIGRPRTCDCGECAKCKGRVRQNEYYQRLTPAERRERSARRDPDKVRASDRARVRDPEYVKARTRRYREANREKKHAHDAVKRALLRGVLLRQPCEVCGDPQTHAHHDDYSQQLEVRWLCPLHHVEVHRRERRAVS